MRRIGTKLVSGALLGWIVSASAFAGEDAVSSCEAYGTVEIARFRDPRDPVHPGNPGHSTYWDVATVRVSYAELMGSPLAALTLPDCVSAAALLIGREYEYGGRTRGVVARSSFVFDSAPAWSTQGLLDGKSVKVKSKAHGPTECRGEAVAPVVEALGALGEIADLKVKYRCKQRKELQVVKASAKY